MYKIALINELIKTYGTKKLDNEGVQVPLKEVLNMFQESNKYIAENYTFYNGHVTNSLMTYSLGSGNINSIYVSNKIISINRADARTTQYMQDISINLEKLEDEINVHIFYSESGWLDVHFKNKMGLSLVTMVFSPKEVQ